MNPEDSLQITIADWLRLQYPKLLWWHTPNGGLRNKIVASKLKRMGVKAGVPDIFIPRGNGGFFCELKIGKNNTTPKQKEVLAQLQELGYHCCIARSLEDFQSQLKQYLQG